MAHHGDNPEALDLAAKLFTERLKPIDRQLDYSIRLKLGPTGQFPEGKLNEDDEGEIKIAIGSQDGKVIMDFGSPVTWVGFTPEQAMQIARALVEHANPI